MSDESDLLTMEQQDSIRNEVEASQPLISQLAVIDVLMDSYKNAELPGFVPGIQYLSKICSSMRKIRGDGNCFYRAFLFGYLDILVKLYESGDEKSITKSRSERDRVLLTVKNSLAELVSLGYNEFTIETFYEELVELLENLFTYSSESLLNLFCVENGSGEYYTWFMRLLTAGFIKRDPERFEPFLDGAYFDVASFCTAEVEPMNKECEQIQIIALTEYLGVSVNIAYLDGRLFDAETGLASVVFPDPSSGLTSDEQFVVYLLYRPGHYDILYKL